MTDRKRRKLADALARLSASVGDIRALGDEISDIVKPDDERRPLPLRVVGPPASQKPVATTKPAAAAMGGNKSLMSLVAASALKEVQQSDEDAQKNWRESLTQLAKELAVSDPETHDRCTRLMRRYDSLAGTVSLYEAKLKQQSNDVVMTEKVQTRLEQEESAWEEALEEREARVAQLQVELRELQRAGEDEEEQKEEEETDAVIDSEVAVLENQGLREALALRMEEKRDIEAAIQSLRRKKRRRDISKEVATQNRDQNRDQDAALRDELERLQAEKDELQAAIFSMEAEQDEAEAAQQDVSALKDALEESKTQRQRVQDELDRQRHLLTRIKTKMKDMVDVQLMAARDTNPPTISEELVILHLLYEHAGEMDMNELKQATTALLATYGKTTSSAAVLRAIYSLVGSLAVHIDRSIGNGVVTSLLV